MAQFPQGYRQIEQRCNAGERRVLQQLKQCLDDEHLVWHDVPIGPRARQPDFVVLGRRWGVLLLEVKDWRRRTIGRATRDEVELHTERGPVTEHHPLRQARDCAMELVDLMQRDPALVHDDGPYQGRLLFPYGWGVVLSGLHRREVEGNAGFDAVFPPARTLLRDDLEDSVDPEVFQQRLLGLFTVHYPHTLTSAQRDRIRWHLFPEIRLNTGPTLPAEAGDALPPVPDLLQVMDLPQERIARTLGSGHRVIHGAAGSGKTMVLVLRAQMLAATARPGQPVLVLCYNRALADRIDALIRQRPVGDRVQVCTYHRWCQDAARRHGLAVGAEPGSEAFYDELPHVVAQAVEAGRVPSGQYDAVLIDEAHDFDDDWLRTAARLVSPDTRSLLVLYDDAQSIYQKTRLRFSLASVGIQAQRPHQRAEGELPQHRRGAGAGAGLRARAADARGASSPARRRRSADHHPRHLRPPRPEAGAVHRSRRGGRSRAACRPHRGGAHAGPGMGRHRRALPHTDPDGADRAGAAAARLAGGVDGGGGLPRLRLATVVHPAADPAQREGAGVRAGARGRAAGDAVARRVDGRRAAAALCRDDAGHAGAGAVGLGRVAGGRACAGCALGSVSPPFRACTPMIAAPQQNACKRAGCPYTSFHAAVQQSFLTYSTLWSNTMTITPEQLAAANKANLDTLVELTQKAFSSIEKLVELNMQAARDSLESTAEQAKAVLTVKGPQELAALQQEFLKPAQDKAVAYGRQVYDIATATQAEVTKVAEAQIAAAKTQFTSLVEEATKNAPQGSEAAVALVKTAMTNASTAFESVQKAAQQATSLAETNLKNLSETAEKATKAATKRRA